MLPRDLIFIRHGQSEGNVASHASEEGDHSLYTAEHTSRHSGSWRLTDKGVWQATQSGLWLKANNLGRFDRYLTSEYLRCVETAGNLGLDGAEWLLDFQLRERDYGLMDVVSDVERKERFAEHTREFDKQRFYATLPSGETMARLCLRLNATLLTDLHAYGAKKPDSAVIIVTHGGVMRAIRQMLERGDGYAYHAREVAGKRSDKIRNCQLLHYTRANPRDPSDVRPHLDWTRSVCPWDPTRSANEWRAIERRRFTNDGLLELANRQPRLINSKRKEGAHENEIKPLEAGH